MNEAPVHMLGAARTLSQCRSGCSTGEENLENARCIILIRESTAQHFLQMHRYWPLPIPYLLADVCTVSAGHVVQFRLDPNHQQLSFLHDHVVSGTCLVAGAVFFEMAALAGRPLFEDGLQDDSKTLAATGCTIPAPMLLLDPEAGASPIVTCDVDARSRAIRVCSEGGKLNCSRVTPVITHLTANLALISEAASSSTSTASAPSSTAAGSSDAAADSQAAAGGQASSSPAAASAFSLAAAARRVLRSTTRAMRRTAEVAKAAKDRGLAELALDVQRHIAGRAGHPAAVDACMHIAAALAEVWIVAVWPEALLLYHAAQFLLAQSSSFSSVSGGSAVTDDSAQTAPVLVSEAVLSQAGEDGEPAPLRVPTTAAAYAPPAELQDNNGWAAAVIQGARDHECILVGPVKQSVLVSTSSRCRAGQNLQIVQEA